MVRQIDSLSNDKLGASGDIDTWTKSGRVRLGEGKRKRHRGDRLEKGGKKGRR